MSNQGNETFEGWCILELMGHRRLAGYVREQEIAGAGMLRLDVHPRKSGDSMQEAPAAIATQFYSPAAVYCITPTTEAIARAVGEQSKPEPVSRYELEPPPPPHNPHADHGRGFEHRIGDADSDEDDGCPNLPF